MACRENITADMARQLLDYDPGKGSFRWRERVPSMFNETSGRTAKQACVLWNARHAGKETGATEIDPGYTRISLFKRHYGAHRVAWLLSSGEWPKNDIDHINGCRTDNRLSNLREATRAQNLQNTSVTMRRSRWLVGASFIARLGRWRASITVDYKTLHLGMFDSEQEAHGAYVAAKAELHTFSPTLRAT